jgi:cytoskeletal protein CcmA (bactofilin family)
MLFRNRRKRQSRINSLIGAASTIEGDVIFSGGLRIDGQVKGNVRVADEQTGTLVVSEHARIEGEIHASHCVINGTVVGSVHAAESLELQSGAQVTGDVHYSNIEVHEGAVVQGRLVHQTETVGSLGLKLASSN